MIYNRHTLFNHVRNDEFRLWQTGAECDSSLPLIKPVALTKRVKITSYNLIHSALAYDCISECSITRKDKGLYPPTTLRVRKRSWGFPTITALHQITLDHDHWTLIKKGLQL